MMFLFYDYLDEYSMNLHEYFYPFCQIFYEFEFFFTLMRYGIFCFFFGLRRKIQQGGIMKVQAWFSDGILLLKNGPRDCGCGLGSAASAPHSPQRGIWI